MTRRGPKSQIKMQHLLWFEPTMHSFGYISIHRNVNIYKTITMFVLVNTSFSFSIITVKRGYATSTTQHKAHILKPFRKHNALPDLSLKPIGGGVLYIADE